MKQKIIITGLSVLLIFTSCNNWLDLRPENDIVLEDFWKTKSDVEAVLASCYKSLTDKACIERMMVWGELRSDNIVQGRGFPGADKDEHDMYDILYGSLTSTNKYASWSTFYTAINRCNILLHYAPQVLAKDNNFTQRDLNYVIGEAMTIRALAYFYLVRTFRDIPWIEDASIDNTQDYAVFQSPEDFVLGKIIDDLNYVKSNGFIRDSYGNNQYDKGRFTKSGLNALLADVYLWKQDYRNCVNACNEVLSNPNLKLVEATDPRVIYQQIFYRGNSTESIFELQFSDKDVKNTAVEDVYGSAGALLGYFAFPAPLVYIERLNRTGLYSPFNYQVMQDGSFESKSDIRAYYSYWEYLFGGDIFGIFKYPGMLYATDINGYPAGWGFRTTTSNWIIYRLPDVMLMKAEALVELEGEQNWTEAMAMVNTTYLRANPVQPLTPLKLSNYPSKVDLEKLVLRERQRELLFEGKRWFDLVRLSRRENSVGKLNSYVNIKMTNATAPLGAVTMDALYMPIAEREIQANRNLKQNPFYENTAKSKK